MKQLFSLFVSLTASSLLFASTTVLPNTTLTKETSNNTSTASNFRPQANGNIGASNISNVSVKSLLYPGFNGKVYAHFQGWFGGSNHMNVGYASNNATQVANQVTDMMNRGVDGAIVDWYGSGDSRTDGTTKLLRAEAEKRGGHFQFAVMLDAGALHSCASRLGCDVTGTLISDLNYAYATYETSPAYISYEGRPIVFFFGTEAYSIDWTRVTASVPGKPMFVERNSGIFGQTTFGGAYAWPLPNLANPADIGNVYLNDFYMTALSHPADLAFGTGYKGFNDELASWSQDRVTSQNCGQTFLATLARVGAYYSTNKQIFSVQLATWNDYEEGTELESGIDNCVSVQGSSVGTKISWSMTGNPNTLDHYTVFVSNDGVNLMAVANVPVSQTYYDFSGYGLAPGNYTVYIKAVGAPFMLNHMSQAISMQVPNVPPTARLTVSATSGVAPAPITADSSTSSDSDGYIAKSTLDFGDGTVITGTTASHVYSNPGTYTITASVTDNDGATAKTTATILVTAPAPTVKPSGVVVTLPTPNSTVVSAVQFIASAKAAYPITAMRIYVDNLSEYTVGAAAINTTLALAKGNHAVTVQAWDCKGNVYKNNLSISVK